MNDTTTEINKDTFWGLIREAKDACGQDMSAMMEYLKETPPNFFKTLLT